MIRTLALAGLVVAVPANAATRIEKASATRIEQAAAVRDAALAKSEAFPMLENLTTSVGQRLAGTPAEARGRDWAVKAMKAAGLTNIKVEPFPLPVWERGAESAEIIGTGQRLAITALGYSGATPPAGIAAPVVYFADYAALQAAAPGSLAGKIAFIDHHMMRAQDGSSYGTNGAVRRTGPALAQSKGAVATLIRSLGTDYHRNPHTGSTVPTAGVAPPPSAALSLPDAELLARSLAAGPVSVRLVSTPRLNPTGQSGNVSGEIPGRVPGEVIVIGGHLDSWDIGQGVIDDGAGIVITLAAAKAIKDAGIKPRRTVRVVFWGAEELGLIGGRAYAEAHKSENIVLAAESDFGADRVWRVSSKVAEAGLPLVAEINSVLAPLGVAPTRDNGASGGPDVGALGAQGVGILELEQDGTRYFDLHHTPDDTLDKVDRAQLDQNVAAWAAATWLAASDDRPLRTK